MVGQAQRRRRPQKKRRDEGRGTRDETSTLAAQSSATAVGGSDSTAYGVLRWWAKAWEMLLATGCWLPARDGGLCNHLFCPVGPVSLLLMMPCPSRLTLES